MKDNNKIPQHSIIRIIASHLDQRFQQLNYKLKHALLLAIGLSMGVSCLFIIAQSLRGKVIVDLLPTSITKPLDIFAADSLVQTNTNGKLQVIILHDTLWFDVTSNERGQILMKEHGDVIKEQEYHPWQLISKAEWQSLITQYHFIPDSTNYPD